MAAIPQSFVPSCSSDLTDPAVNAYQLHGGIFRRSTPRNCRATHASAQLLWKIKDACKCMHQAGRERSGCIEQPPSDRDLRGYQWQVANAILSAETRRHRRPALLLLMIRHFGLCFMSIELSYRQELGYAMSAFYLVFYEPFADFITININAKRAASHILCTNRISDQWYISF